MNQNDILPAVAAWILLIALPVLLVVRHRQKPQRTHWLKPSRVIALVCVLLLCGTALYIYNNSQAQKAQARQPPSPVTKSFSLDEITEEAPPPAQTPMTIAPSIRKSIASKSFGLDEAVDPLGIEEKRQPISEAEAFLDAPDAKTGLPAGAWASTLVPVPTENNLFRDPVTRKLYRVQNGAIVLETNPYAGWTLQELKLFAKINSDVASREAEEHRQNLYLYELHRGNDIAEQQRQIMANAEFNQRMQASEQSEQNRKAINEIQEIRYDNRMQAINEQYQPQNQSWLLKYNSFENRWQYVPPNAQLKYNALANRWEFVPQ
jgi:nucleotidyltransferase/DNA polymerase involved in DNA repair